MFFSNVEKSEDCLQEISYDLDGKKFYMIVVAKQKDTPKTGEPLNLTNCFVIAHKNEPFTEQDRDQAKSFYDQDQHCSYFQPR